MNPLPLTPPQKRLRILHLTAASNAGGLSRYLLDLCLGLIERGHEVAVAGQRGPWHSRFASAPWPWIDLPLLGGPIALWQAQKFLRNYLADHPADIIHTHYRRSTLVARRASRQIPIPILYTVHQPRISLRGPLRYLSDFGDHTHAPSQDARRWLIDTAHIPDQRISVIPHGIDIPRFPQRDAATKAKTRADLKLPLDATVAAFVGRMDVLKNPDWIVELAIASRSALPDAKFILAGEGPHEPALRRMIAQNNLQDRVLMLGECEALPVYQAADALLSPSLREGFGLVCAEAMCVGIPVLRTHTGGSEEMIIEGITGNTTPVDQKAFIAAAITFLSDRSALQQMGLAASEHIRAHFTLPRQIEDTIALYQRMIR